MARPPTILFTCFEPSGDALAAAVIAELKRQRPESAIFGFGGPQMAEAGAELIEASTDRAVMLADSLREMFVHRRRLQRLRRWLAEHEVDVVVPTDSPAANWSVCKLVRGAQPGARIVHLVMPQLWAWAAWRLGKLRRLSDHVLCLLPFEPAWLEQRGVAATFVGHPLYEASAQAPPRDDPALPKAGEPKLALLPGSRPSEIKANWPTMLATYERLRREHPQLVACVAASDAQRRAQLEAMQRRHHEDGELWPQGMSVLTGDATAVLDWSDVALVVSGTATLHTASRKRPMVVLYNVNRWGWSLVGRWVVSTRTFSLPNLIAERLEMGRVVPELVPHFGAVEPVVDALRPLMTEGAPRQAQRAAFEAMAHCFSGQGFAATAAAALLAQAEAAGPRRRAASGTPAGSVE